MKSHQLIDLITQRYPERGSVIGTSLIPESYLVMIPSILLFSMMLAILSSFSETSLTTISTTRDVDIFAVMDSSTLTVTGVSFSTVILIVGTGASFDAGSFDGVPAGISALLVVLLIPGTCGCIVESTTTPFTMLSAAIVPSGITQFSRMIFSNSGVITSPSFSYSSQSSPLTAT